MAIAFQGFAIKENLSESENDRAVLNNIGGSPIGDDITLLFNNNRNTSELVITEADRQGFEIVIETSLAVFANKTKVQVNGLTYYVKNSNGINRFFLSADSDLISDVLPPIGTYVRSDEITFSNIENFSRTRRNPDVNRVDVDTQLGFLNNSSTSTLLSSNTVKQQLESTERNIDFYNFRSNSSVKINKNFLSFRIAEIGGAVIIKDIDGLNDSGLTNTSPGLFIYNAETNSGIRAFSSADNPWSAVGSDLEVESNSITVKNLNFLSSSIIINSKNSAVLAEDITSANIDNTSFTHKVPITVNGEVFFLCLKLED